MVALRVAPGLVIMAMRWRTALCGTAAAGLLIGLALSISEQHRDHSRDADPVERPGERADLPARLRTADPSRGATLFSRCAACHPIGSGSVDRDGPNLYGVVGSPVAARRPRFAYTAALRAFGGIWSVDRLDAWLANPAALVPGTTMTFPGVPDPTDRADLIAYLASQGTGRTVPDRP